MILPKFLITIPLLCSMSVPLVAMPVFEDSLADWDHNGNGFVTVTDPTDAGNTVLNASNKGGNRVSGESISPIGNTESGTLSFRFYLQDNSSADLAIGLTELTPSTISQSDGTFMGPYFRLVDSKIQVYEGNGSGSGGSFEDVDQAIAIQTWYSVSLTANNATDSWSASISGGSYSSATTLTHSTTDSSFGFRNADGGPLSNFAIRTNNSNNGSSALLDDISMVPEPSTLTLLGLAAVCAFSTLRRRR